MDKSGTSDASTSLNRSEEQFRLLVQGVTDYAIYMLDTDGRVSSWNAGAQRIKGYAPDEILGQHFSRFYTAEDRARGAPQNALDTAARTGRFEAESLRVRKDGTTFVAHVIIDPIRDPAGTLIGFAKITRDITERRQVQHELELAREALFQSQKMDAIGQLTGGIAHDFNNLLMAVLGSLELAKKRLPDDPQLKRLIENATQAAHRGTTLTQRMLAFARRQSLDPRTIDLPLLVRNMVELLRRAIGPSVEIETRFPLLLSAVAADENQLEMALLNLAVNARDAMPEGGAIVIAARNETVDAGHPTGLPPGAYVCLAVTDKGFGMDEETLAHAAEPFFTTKGIGKGTGLGLPMVHGMAEQIGGRFVLKSSIGKGTTAEIWLLVAAKTDEARASAPPETEPQKRRALTVLAVDDDVLVLFNTVAMLEDLGHTVIQSCSGTEALQLLAGHSVDLVITDQAMPQMTGVQLLCEVKKTWPALPAILATGYAELPEGAGKDLVRLGKPFSERELARAIGVVFGEETRRTAQV